MSDCDKTVARGTGQVSLRLSDTAEARRLRAMLRAAERCDGSTIGMISVNVSPEDGLQIILSGNAIDEMDEATLSKVWADIYIETHALLANAAVQALWRDHPEIAQRCFDEAVETFRAAADAHNHGKKEGNR